MKNISKVLVTIVVIFVFLLLYVPIVGSSSSGRPGLIGLILFVGLIGGIRAIWKSSTKDKSSNDKDDSILQK
ncbi:MAG: hypothetical protein IJY36_08685 [Coprobacter sp.]|nr:hypothetical protein [Coprobacter sp.]